MIDLKPIESSYYSLFSSTVWSAFRAQIQFCNLGRATHSKILLVLRFLYSLDGLCNQPPGLYPSFRLSSFCLTSHLHSCRNRCPQVKVEKSAYIIDLVFTWYCGITIKTATFPAPTGIPLPGCSTTSRAQTTHTKCLSGSVSQWWPTVQLLRWIRW